MQRKVDVPTRHDEYKAESKPVYKPEAAAVKTNQTTKHFAGFEQLA